MPDEQRKLQQLLEMNQEIEQAKDVDLLLERILTVARKLVNADAGSIYVVKDENSLEFSHTQNETLQQQLEPGKKPIYNRFTMPINPKSIAGCVASTGETLNIADVYQLAATLVVLVLPKAFVLLIWKPIKANQPSAESHRIADLRSGGGRAPQTLE